MNFGPLCRLAAWRPADAYQAATHMTPDMPKSNSEEERDNDEEENDGLFDRVKVVVNFLNVVS